VSNCGASTRRKNLVDKRLEMRAESRARSHPIWDGGAGDPVPGTGPLRRCATAFRVI